MKLAPKGVVFPFLFSPFSSVCVWQSQLPSSIYITISHMQYCWIYWHILGYCLRRLLARSPTGVFFPSFVSLISDQGKLPYLHLDPLTSLLTCAFVQNLYLTCTDGMLLVHENAVSHICMLGF